MVRASLNLSVRVAKSFMYYCEYYMFYLYLYFRLSVEQDSEAQDKEIIETRKILSELALRYEELREKYIHAEHDNNHLIG